MKDCYMILGIEPTRDIKEIKRAYGRLLPLNNPETDPEGFKVLRAAYEEAMAKINEKDTSDNKAVLPVDEFISTFEKFYFNFEKRIDVDSWKALLENDICFQIDTGKEVSLRILNFITEHYYFPSEVWKLFDAHFSWSSKKDELYTRFPKNFIDFVVNKTKYKDYFRYRNLLDCKENKQEQFLVEFHKASAALEDYNLYDFNKSIVILNELCPEHPDLLILIARHMAVTGKVDDAIKLLTSIAEQNSDDVYAHIFRGHYLFRMGKNEETCEDYKKAIALYPNSIEILFSLGKCCTVLGRYEEAVTYLETLCELSQNSHEAHVLLYSARGFQLDNLLLMIMENPDNLDFRFKLAKLYYSTKKTEECYEILSELEQNKQLNEEMYILLSTVLFIMGKKELAYSTCCNAINMFPDDYGLYSHKALLLDELGNYEESVNTYEIAIGLNPNDATSYNNKAYSLNRLNRFNEALESANKAILLDPSMANAYKNKADALLGLQLLGECLDACEEALNLNIYTIDVYVIKMKLFQRVNQYENALIVYSRAEDLNLRNNKLLFEKANTFRLMGRLDEASNICDSILEMEPENNDTYYCKGMCYFNKEDYKEAINCLEKSQVNSNYIENSYYYKILSLLNIKDTHAALRDLDIIIKMDTVNRDRFHDLKGEILFDENRYEESIAEYKNAVHKNPDYAYYYYRLGKACNRLKQYDKAIKYFSLAIEKDSSKPEVYIDKSHALYNIGKYKECAAECDIVLNSDPNYMMAYQNKSWALFAAGNISEAENSCNKGLKIDGNHLSLLRLKLDILKKKNMPNEGLVVIDRILEIDPNDKNILIERENIKKLIKSKSGILGRLLG